MGYFFKKASLDDIELLVRTRTEILRTVNGLDDSADMTEVERESRAYYERALQDGSHTACLVFDGSVFIGAGGISYYTVMPTCHDPTGKKAYIMNMYTKPEYRRKGIATKTLDLLVQDAIERGITFITLEATEMGRALYENYGFVQMTSEMKLPI